MQVHELRDSIYIPTRNTLQDVIEVTPALLAQSLSLAGFPRCPNLTWPPLPPHSAATSPILSMHCHYSESLGACLSMSQILLEVSALYIMRESIVKKGAFELS